MWTRFLKSFVNVLPALLCLMHPTIAQNITNLTVESVTCSSVIISAGIDPVSSAFTFSWVVSASNGIDIDIALVGLNGLGNVLMLDQGSEFDYSISNMPDFLPNNNDPFLTILTFNFEDNESNTDFVFGVVSTTLDVRINDPVSKPRCPMTVQNLDVVCIDNSQDCFLCGSDVTAVIVCSNNLQLFANCNENGIFDFGSCPTGVRCSPLEDSGYVGSCTNFNLAGSLCKLGCELGQHLRTNHRNGYKPKVRCLSNGEWHPSLSLIENCREGFDPRCPAVNSDQGGVCSICQVPCPDNRICCPTACSGGSNCIEVRCPALEDSNYVGTCTNVNRVGSICRLSCQPGERLTSARRVRCLSDGSWYPPLERIEDCQEGFDPKCPAVRPGVISICPICETPCPIDTTCCENGCGSTCIDNNQLNSCPGVSIPNLRYQCNRQVCYLSCDRGTVLVGPRKTSCNYLRRNSNYIRCRRVFYSYYGYRG